MPNPSMAHTPNTPMRLETLFKPLGPIGVSGAVTATGVVALGVEPIGVWIILCSMLALTSSMEFAPVGVSESVN